MQRILTSRGAALCCALLLIAVAVTPVVASALQGVMVGAAEKSAAVLAVVGVMALGGFIPPRRR